MQEGNQTALNFSTPAAQRRLVASLKTGQGEVMDKAFLGDVGMSLLSYNLIGLRRPDSILRCGVGPADMAG
jgi:hypothetical protein